MPAGNTALILGISREDVDADREPLWRRGAELAAVALLSLAAILGPMALGGTHPLGKLGINLLVGMATLLWAVTAPRSGWLAWLPIAVAGGALVQIVPLPASLLALIAPFSTRAWATVSEGDPLRWGTISIDPGATAAAIRQVFLGLSATVVTMDLCRRPLRRLVLCAAIAVAGLMVWGLGIVYPMNDDHVVLGRHDLKGPEENLSWCTTLLPPVRTAGFIEYSQSGPVRVGEEEYYLPRWQIGDGMGSYVVSNHFAAGMYLTLPLLLALCRQRLRGPVWSWAGATLTLIIFGGAFWTVGMVAHSRGGAGAIVLATAVFMALSTRARWSRLLWGGISLMALLALIGFFTIYFFRLTSLADVLPDLVRVPLTNFFNDPRIALNKMSARAFAAAPLFGSGLGSWGFVQPTYGAGKPTVFYAHNDYAQILAETGLIGGAVMGGLVALLLAAFVRTWKASQSERMLAAGAWASLAAIGLHSFFDFNMHIPANALLVCLVAGIALSTTASFPTGCLLTERDRAGIAHVRAPGSGAMPWSARRGIVAVLIVGACVMTMLLSARDYETEKIARRLRYALYNIRTAKTEDARALAVGRLQWGIVNAKRARRLHPTDSELPMLAGQAALHLEALGEGLEGEETMMWFRRARACNPLMWGSPQAVKGR